MVCIPCIVIPAALWFYHRFIHPLVLAFAAAYQRAQDNTFFGKLIYCFTAILPITKKSDGAKKDDDASVKATDTCHASASKPEGENANEALRQRGGATKAS